MKRFCCQHCGGTEFFEISSMPLFGSKEIIPVILRRHHNGPRVLVRQHRKRKPVAQEANLEDGIYCAECQRRLGHGCRAWLLEVDENEGLFTVRECLDILDGKGYPAKKKAAC